MIFYSIFIPSSHFEAVCQMGNEEDRLCAFLRIAPTIGLFSEAPLPF